MGVMCWDDCEVRGLKVLFPLQNLLRKIGARTSTLSELEEPIRAELFSTERLEQHAESLATAQQVTPTPRKGRGGCYHAYWTTDRCCSHRIGLLLRPSAKNASSPLRPNGWSTTSILWTNIASHVRDLD